jgi:hypothetical protein
MESDSERRNFGRGMVSMAVVVTAQDGTTMAGGCRDLSLDGVFVCGEPRMAVGTPCRVVMTHTNGRKTVTMEARGAVARHTPGGIGIRFTAVGAEDLRKMYHLLQEAALVVSPAEPD